MMIWAPLAKSPNCASQRHQGVGRLDRVAVLEAERGVLRQQRVVTRRNGPASDRPAEMGEGDPLSPVA